jgi:hypothetical protein
MTSRLKIAVLAFTTSVLATPLAATAGTVTLFSDNFDGTIIDPSITTTGTSVSQHDGVLDIQNAVTDAGGVAQITFAPVSNISATFQTYIQDGGSTFFNPTFDFSSQDWTTADMFSLARHQYDHGGSNYNHPMLLMIQNSVPTYTFFEQTSSDFYNEWLNVTMSYDTTTGLFDVKFGALGGPTHDISATLPDVSGEQISRFDMNPAGWWTGHSMQVDNLDITTNTSDVPEPSSMALLAFSLLGLGYLAYRRREVSLTAAL